MCRRNKYEVCKFGDKCRYLHINEICEEQNCNVYNCERRHPQICNYQRTYGRSKFTEYCSYSHNKPGDILENINKIAILEKKIENIQETNNINVSNECKKIENLESKLDNLESQIITMNKASEEKDSLISDLEKRLESIQKNCLDKFNVKEIEMNKKFKDIENVIKKQKKTKIEQFNCTDCNFTTTSKQGLKTHVKRKHTNLHLDKYPKTCEFCDTEVDDEKQMKLHLKCHTYKEPEDLKYKCEDCDYWGPNELTMEMHTKRCHSEHFDCGLCDFNLKHWKIWKLTSPPVKFMIVICATFE